MSMQFVFQIARSRLITIGQAAVDAVFGFDYFISYAWADGGQYATALARMLRDAGFVVHFDRDDFQVGHLWRALGRRALRNTSRLVVVITDAALTSHPVRFEISQFRLRSREIVPIVIADALSRDRPDGIASLLEADLLRIHEGGGALAGGPSVAAIDRLVRSFRMARQNAKRLRIVSATALAFLIAAAAASYFAWSSQREAILARLHAQAAQAVGLKTSNPARGLLLAMLATDRSIETQHGVVLSSVHASLFAYSDLVEEHNEVAQLGPPSVTNIVRAGEGATHVVVTEKGVWSVDGSGGSKSIEAAATCAAVLPNGMMAIAVGGEVRLIDRRGTATQSIAVRAQSIAYLPSANALVLGGQDLELWQFHDSAPLVRSAVVEGVRNVDAIAWSEPQGLLAVSHSLGEIDLFRVVGSSVIRDRSFERIRLPSCSLSFSRKGRWLAAAGNDGFVRLWDIEAREATAMGSFPVWDQGRSRQNPLRQYQGHQSPVLCVEFSPVEDVVAAGSADGYLRLWTPAGDVLGEIQVSSSYLRALSWSVDGTRIMTGDTDGILRSWHSTWPSLLKASAACMRESTLLQDPAAEVPEGARELIERLLEPSRD